MAKRDAHFYVLSSHGRRAGGVADRSPGRGPPVAAVPTDDAFFESGVKAADRIFGVGEPSGRGACVEIGCGPGRVLFAMAPRFDRVIGFDVSGEMVRLANQSERRPANAEARVIGSCDQRFPGIPDGSIDLVYSTLVFQHIASWECVSGFIHAAAAALAPGGRVAFQFDTRPARLMRSVYMTLPDALLPDVHRRGMRRHPRSPSLVRTTLADAGLRVIDDEGEWTEEHLLVAELDAETHAGGDAVFDGGDERSAGGE